MNDFQYQNTKVCPYCKKMFISLNEVCDKCMHLEIEEVEKLKNYLISNNLEVIPMSTVMNLKEFKKDFIKRCIHSGLFQVIDDRKDKHEKI